MKVWDLLGLRQHISTQRHKPLETNHVGFGTSNVGGAHSAERLEKRKLQYALPGSMASSHFAQECDAVCKRAFRCDKMQVNDFHDPLSYKPGAMMPFGHVAKCRNSRYADDNKQLASRTTRFELKIVGRIHRCSLDFTGIRPE